MSAYFFVPPCRSQILSISLIIFNISNLTKNILLIGRLMIFLYIYWCLVFFKLLTCIFCPFLIGLHFCIDLQDQVYVLYILILWYFVSLLFLLVLLMVYLAIQNFKLSMYSILFSFILLGSTVMLRKTFLMPKIMKKVLLYFILVLLWFLTIKFLFLLHLLCLMV